MLGIILTIITMFAGGLAVSNTQMATVPNNSFEAVWTMAKNREGVVR